MQLRYPEINAKSPSEQIKQISSFLRQLVDTLNIGIAPSEESDTQTVVRGSKMPPVASSSSGEKTAKETFDGIKGMIIKSADIIDAYYEEMNKSFSGQYIAQSEFGKYVEETGLDIIINSQEIQQLFSKTESIYPADESKSVKIINSNAVVTVGVVDKTSDGYDAYGIKIGQITTNEYGQAVEKMYATYTSEGVTLYDGSGNATAKLIDGELIAERVSIRGSIKIGGYREYIGSDGSIIDRWEGWN